MSVRRGDRRTLCGNVGSSGREGEKLTLVVDEAVGGEQFEGVDFEQDSVEQKIVSRRTEFGIVTQTRLCELLQRAKGHSSQCHSTAQPSSVGISVSSNLTVAC